MLNSDGLLSLLFASIELVLILNLLHFADKNKVNQVSLSLLILLFAYQLIEFIICGLSFKSSIWAYFALLSVTFMPPLTLFMILKYLIRSKNSDYFIFLPAAFFSIYYILVIDKFEVVKCTAVYAVYNYPLGFLYGLFYYLPILAVIILTGYFSYLKTDKKNNKAKILFWGFSITFIPGFIFTRTVPGMLQAAESILCSFAFILFIFISYFILSNRNIEK